MFLCTVASEIEIMPFVSVGIPVALGHSGHQAGCTYINLKEVNFHGRNAGGQTLKQFVGKGGIQVSRILHSRCLSGSIMCCKHLKKIVRQIFH